MARKKKRKAEEPSLEFSKANLWFALGGVAIIGLGYYLLGQGSITLAPVLLVLGYVVLLPLAIIR
ncbi:MAG: hypothetical protein OXU64_09345 [Gemmatimonadota bacterium]|nr:hypothetical protein [Gemmatimonadota bacterium]